MKKEDVDRIEAEESPLDIAIGTILTFNPESKSQYEIVGGEIGKLVDKKQIAYGNSFGKGADVLKVLYPDGVAPEQYTDMLCLIRIIDKLFRIASQKDAFGESPYKDIAGYGLLGAVKDSQG